MSGSSERAAERRADLVERILASDRLDTTAFAQATHGATRWLALVVKRTYRITNHRCELAAPAEQELLQEGEIPYNPKLPKPQVSPPVFVNDAQILRARTDVVVQAIAHAYDKNTRKLSAKVRFGKYEREIVVYGERRGEMDRMGRPRFSEPEPIKSVPVRYDYAYGGVDRTALARYPDPTMKALEAARPEYAGASAVRFRYPRNPCGRGYLVELDEESFTGLRIPNLEYPFDPLSPARLAVRDLKRWVRGPLPAGWDWQSQTWFPRSGYIGMARDVEDREEIPEEAKRGWAARDILANPPIHHDPERLISPEFVQAASPGMSVPDLSPAESFVLTNLHPRKPTYSFQLPGEVLRASVELSPGVMTELQPHLDSIVVRPDPGEVVAVWSARTIVPRSYSYDETRNMRRRVGWAVQKEA